MDQEKIIEIYLKGYEEGQEKAWSNIKNLVSKHDGWELRSRVESKIGTLYQDIEYKRSELRKNPQSLQLDLEENQAEEEEFEEQVERELPSWNISDSHIIIEPKPNKGFDEYKKLNLEGYPGMVITRDPPSKILKRYDLDGDNTKFIWLSKSGSLKIDGIDVERISPSDLSGLSSNIGVFLKNNKNGIVFLSGVPYLNNFSENNKVLNFISWVKDRITEHKGFYLLSISDSAVDKKFIEKVKGEFDEVID
ncbi:MAG: DUF835 domain-containing protein [Thermoplasmatota archaeon]